MILNEIVFDDPIEKDDDNMLLSDWLSAVKEGTFIDYDGEGILAVADKKSKFLVRPSFVRDGKISCVVKDYDFRIEYGLSDEVMKQVTHITWYNR